MAVVLRAPGPSLAQGTATETVGFSINVEPVFAVNSSSAEGGNIELRSPAPGEPPATKTATVTVRSNLGRPYRILQRLEQEFPPVLFTATDGTNGGQSGVKSPTPLTTQPVVIFTSAPSGESDTFHISYTVPARQKVPAGSYRARILIEKELR